MELKQRRKRAHYLCIWCAACIVFLVGGLVLSTTQTHAAVYDCKIQFKAGSGATVKSDTYKLDNNGIVVFKANGNTKIRTIKSTDDYCDLPNLDTIGFTRTGYHCKDGVQAYKNDKGALFNSQNTKKDETNSVTTLRLNNGTQVKKDATFTLSPNWIPNTVKVTFDPNTNGGAYTGSFTTQTFTYDKSGQTFVGKLERKEYNLVGWAFSKTATTPDHAVNATVVNAWIASHSNGGNGNVTLYAVWQPKVFAITLDNQNATTAGTAAFFEKYNTGYFSTSACTNAIDRVTPPAKTGCTFGGYFTGKDGQGKQCTNASGEILTSFRDFSANTTLYAKWIEKTASLTYDVNGGTLASGMKSKDTMKFSDPYLIQEGTPTRTGYKFAGWNTKADGTGATYNAQAVYKEANVVPQDSVLYAKWTELTANLTYDLNGGSFTEGIINPVVMSYSKETCVLEQKPFWEGHTFIGWSSNKDGTGLQYKINDTVKIANEIPKNTTLYAQWVIGDMDVQCAINGHQMITEASTNPTETKNGSTGKSYCIACGLTVKESTVIPASVQLTTIENVYKGIQIKWIKPDNVTGFIVYRNTNNGKFVQYETIQKNTDVFVDTKVKNGTQYSYKVVAFITTGSGKVYGASSSQKDIVRVQSVKFKKVGATKTKKGKLFVLTWSKDKKASGYQIIVKNNTGKVIKKKTIKKGSITKTTISGIKASKGKFYIRPFHKKGKNVYYGSWCKKPVSFKLVRSK